MMFETPRGRSVDAAHVGTTAASNLGATTSNASNLGNTIAAARHLGATASAAAPTPANSVVRVNSQGYHLLGQTVYSSRYFLGPEDLKEVGGTANEPATIRLVVLILKNDWNHKVGKSKFRIVHIDIGDGKKTHLYVDNDSDLYRIKAQGTNWERGAIARLHDFSFELKPVRLIGRFDRDSRVGRRQKPRAPLL